MKTLFITHSFVCKRIKLTSNRFSGNSLRIFFNKRRANSVMQHIVVEKIKHLDSNQTKHEFSKRPNSERLKDETIEAKVMLALNNTSYAYWDSIHSCCLIWCSIAAYCSRIEHMRLHKCIKDFTMHICKETKFGSTNVLTILLMHERTRKACDR